MDDPLPTFRSFYGLFLIVIAIHGIYLFGVLPRITTLEMLIAALMPAFLLFGWMSARPATARLGFMLAVYISVQLALNRSYSADFSSFANSSVALMVGVSLTGVICGIVRLLGANWIAGRLLRSNWTTLAAVAERKSGQDRLALASLMQHRLALLAARITVVPAEARSDAANLRQLRTALSIHRCQAGELWPVTPYQSSDRSVLCSSCFGLPDSYRGPLPDGLVKQLDSTIALTLQEPSGEARDEALIGSRRHSPRAFPGIAGLSAAGNRTQGELPHEIRT